jgi:hypothetical protein
MYILYVLYFKGIQSIAGSGNGGGFGTAISYIISSSQLKYVSFFSSAFEVQ